MKRRWITIQEAKEGLLGGANWRNSMEFINLRAKAELQEVLTESQWKLFITLLKEKRKNIERYMAKNPDYDIPDEDFEFIM